MTTDAAKQDTSEKPTKKSRKKQSKKPNQKSRKKSGKAQFYKWARTLHIYVSSSLFALLIMFCVTGFLLNHDDWFKNDYQDAESALTLPTDVQQLLQNGWEIEQVPVNAILAHIKQQHPNLPKPDSTNVDYELKEITIDYKVPAGYANVAITEDDSIISYRKGGLVSIMKDLHRGRDAGGLWSWLIDIMAFSIMFFAITGIILMFQNKRRRKAGTIATVVGLLTPIILVILFVPSL